MTKTVLVRISGRVQGVWFRGWTIDEAEARGLRGWVRNRRDGSVEALFSGPADAVNEMVELCRRGPPAARVDALTQRDADPPAERGFQQLPTA
jgi:acylphosphatase